jgi:ABC-type branched-subunit amino acid transport system substrate-binding protein
LNKLQSIALRAAAVALFAPVACFAQRADLPVGAIESMTGPIAVAGMANACGLRIGEAELAKEGRPKNYRLVLNLEDDQGKPATAVQAATKLSSQGIKHMVGGTSTFTVLAILPAINDAGMFYTGGVVKADELLKTGGHIVRLGNPTSRDGPPIADYVAKKLGAKKIAFVAQKGVYGEGVLASIKAALPPGSEISKEFLLPVEQIDFRSVLTTIAADKPDAVIYGIAGTNAAVAWLRQYKQADIKIPLIATLGILNVAVTKSAGGAGDGVVSAAFWSSAIDNPANRKLTQSFNEFRGKIKECDNVSLDTLVALSYSQMELLAGAIDKSNSLDPATLKKTVVASTWDLPQGTVTFEPNGQARVQTHLVIGKGDDVVPLK